MSRDQSESPAPPTLAWLSRDVDGIAAECLSCGYKRELPLAPMLAKFSEVEFRVFARRLKCSACESRDVEARAWRNPMPTAGVDPAASTASDIEDLVVKEIPKGDQPEIAGVSPLVDPSELVVSSGST